MSFLSSKLSRQVTGAPKRKRGRPPKKATPLTVEQENQSAPKKRGRRKKVAEDPIPSQTATDVSLATEAVLDEMSLMLDVNCNLVKLNHSCLDSDAIAESGPCFRTETKQ
jgi:hypothetical protein